MLSFGVRFVERVEEINQNKEENKILDRAKELINDYCRKEFDSNADFTDLSRIPIAYIEFEENERKDKAYSVQVYIDLNNYKLITEFNKGERKEEKKYDSLEELIEYELNWLSFDSLIAED